MPVSSALLAAFGVLLAQEPTETPASALRRTLYFHPLITAMTQAAGAPTTIPLTYEHQLAPARSLSVQPMLILGTIDRNADHPDIDMFQLAVTGCYRMYFNGQETRRWYFAPGLGTGWATLNWDADGRYLGGTGSAGVFGVVSYLGYVFRGTSLALDLNLGGGFRVVSGGGENMKSWTSSGPLLDANIGLGFDL